MSATADVVTVLAPAAGRSTAAADTRAGSPSRPVIRLISFAALATYGVMRWSALLTPAPVGRLVGLLCLGVVAAGALGALVRRGSMGLALAATGAVLVASASVAIAGVPLQLLLHGHLGAIASGIDQGLTALPRVTVPYEGIDPWVRTAILLGAAVLLLDAGFLLAFAPGSLGDARRAAAALPLTTLAVVPSTLMRPAAPYLHGLLLFALIGALLWGERLPAGRLAGAGVLGVAAGLIGLGLAPALDSHRPWVNYESLAGAFSTSNLETFDWTQRYGPLVWPRTGREILDVRAPRGDYWKAENLDLFNGVGWTEGAVETGSQLPAPDASAQARWTERLRVTVRSMQTTDLVAAGYATVPDHAPTAVVGGPSPGTWMASVDLGPGDTYDVSAYSPRPTVGALAAIHSIGSDDLTAGYRSLLLPPSAASPYGQPEVLFPPFHSGLAVETVAPTLSDAGPALVSSSPYGAAYALAQRLAAASGTPIDFIEAVERYLSRGFTYDENPPPRRYPLESFLFEDRRGYCQQFSGAMALLLRMGGIPARVAAGFTSGTYDQTTGQWIVSDLDAHAWVEAWFPHFGWVRFDPTPTAAPARAGGEAAAALATRATHTGGQTPRTARRGESPGPVSPSHRRVNGGTNLVPAMLAALLLAALLLAALVTRRLGEPSIEARLVELERSFARCGRPLESRTTLASLEHRFRASPAAAGYIRALRLARYGEQHAPPHPEGRRAMRVRLAEGLGWSGRLRAWWALPPRMR